MLNNGKIRKLISSSLIALAIITALLIFFTKAYFVTIGPISNLKSQINNKSDMTNNLYEILEKKEVYGNKYMCWEADNSRCGIINVIGTEISMEQFKSKIEENDFKIISKKGATGLLSVLTNLNKNYFVTVDGKPIILAAYNSSITDKGYLYTIDNNGQKIDVTYYDTTGNNIKINGKKIDKGIIEIIVYTKNTQRGFSN